jgi:hypothetical protein
MTSASPARIASSVSWDPVIVKVLVVVHEHARDREAGCLEPREVGGLELDGG